MDPFITNTIHYTSPIWFSNTNNDIKLERYIINDKATILFWSDDTKTVSKRHKEDVFDKELGFLLAYYYKKCGYTNNARKRIIDTINYDKIKTFLFEFYVKDSDKTYNEARVYLKNLMVDNKNK